MKTSHGRKVRYAVAGLGHLAQVAILPAFRRTRNSELAALLSSDARKLAKLGSQYGVSRCYSYYQYEECLAEALDAVYIALPNHLHREFTVRALEALVDMHLLNRRRAVLNLGKYTQITSSGPEKAEWLEPRHRATV